MGRSPRCSKDGLNKGAWTALEDETLVNYVKSHGEGKWNKLAKSTGKDNPHRSFFVIRKERLSQLFPIC